MKYQCTLKQDVDYGKIDEMSKLFNLERNLVHLLYSRGIDNKDKLQKYLNPSKKDLDRKSVV